MKRHTLEYIVNVCNELYKIPTIVEAYSELNANKLILTSKWNQLDFERNDRIRFEKKFVFNLNKDNDDTVDLIYSSDPYQIPSDIWRVKSPNGQLTAAITNWKDKSEDKQFLELWNSKSKITNINLNKLNKHGKIYEQMLEWSQNSSKLAYIAECVNKRTETSLINAKINKIDDDKKNSDFTDENNYDEKYSNQYVDEWGEQLIGKSKSTIAVFDIKSNELKIIDNIPDDYSPANLCWYKNDGIVFSAYYTLPYRLGLIYCPIRKSDLFYYDLGTQKCVKLTSDNASVRDPRFSHDYSNLVWLENPVGGPHFRCSKLMLMNWATKSIETLVDIVGTPDYTKNEFPGIFGLNLSPHCWSNDNTRVILNTNWNHKMRIISVDVETKKVTSLDNGLSDLSYTEYLHLNEKDWLCALNQSYNKEPGLIIAHLPDRGKENEIKWNFIDCRLESNLLNSTVELLQFKPTRLNLKYSKENFEALLVTPKEKNDVLVVFPHGGPHSAYACEFSYHVAVLNKLGYSVLMINYRGSIGYGQNNVDSLPGLIGDQDVKDCQQAADYCMNTFKYTKAVLYGGSHGGFLSAHLAGQYPDFYSAVSIRNPVINLDSMRCSSDIPDWIITETFGIYDYDYKTDELDSQAKQKLYECSPIRYVNQVKAPILLMVGGSDLRVPSTQSIEYYKALKARNNQVKMLWFKEDNHTLGKTHTTVDCIINTVLWYEKYLN